MLIRLETKNGNDSTIEVSFAGEKTNSSRGPKLPICVVNLSSCNPHEEPVDHNLPLFVKVTNCPIGQDSLEGTLEEWEVHTFCSTTVGKYILSLIVVSSDRDQMRPCRLHGWKLNSTSPYHSLEFFPINKNIFLLVLEKAYCAVAWSNGYDISFTVLNILYWLPRWFWVRSSVRLIVFAFFAIWYPLHYEHMVMRNLRRWLFWDRCNEWLARLHSENISIAT